MARHSLACVRMFTFSAPALRTTNSLNNPNLLLNKLIVPMKYGLYSNLKSLKNFLFIALLVVTSVAYGQNKTLGVGTTTPNPNAALHVESPTNNQGLLIPRLTTAQRTAMTLGTPDAGLLVYDTDLDEVVSWDGTQWSKGGYFESNGTTATIHAVNNGTIGTDVAGSAAVLAETTTAFSALTARVPASASQANAISGITQSTDPGSWAGYFDATTGTAVYAVTRSNVGGVLAPVGIYGESTGTGSSAAAFRINNASNTYSAVFVETNGTGPGVFVNQINNGVGIHMEKGTLKYSVINVTTTGAIPSRAGAYEITTSGTFTFGFGAVPGETCFVLNNSGNAIFVEAIELANQEITQFIYLGGMWRKAK